MLIRKAFTFTLFLFIITACGDQAPIEAANDSEKAPSSAMGQNEPAAGLKENQSPQAEIFTEDASKEAEVLAEMHDCELEDGAKPNSIVCLRMDQRFYAWVIANDDGSLDEVGMAQASQDGWSTELPELERTLERYFALEVSRVKNIYSGLFHSDPNQRSGTQMALNSIMNTHSMFSDSKMVVPPDTQAPFVAFSFKFD